MEKQYTNEITGELIARIKAPYTAQEMARMDENRRAVIEAHLLDMAARTLISIWRFATEGALSRNGGRIEHGSRHFTFPLSEGRKANKALVGDEVVYPDGSRARIISGSGYAATDGGGVAFALVGSQLDNGDEIISTPQNIALLCQWDNSPAMPDDFLIAVPVCHPQGAL